MKAYSIIAIFISFTVILSSQECIKVCNEYQKKLETITSQKSLSDVSNFLSEKSGLCKECQILYYEALNLQYDFNDRTKDYIEQSQTLRLMDSTLYLIQFESDQVKRITYLEYKFKKALYRKALNQLDQAGQMFGEILDSIGDPIVASEEQYYLFNLTLQQQSYIEKDKSNYNTALKIIQYSIDTKVERAEKHNLQVNTNSLICRQAFYLQKTKDYESSFIKYNQCNAAYLSYIRDRTIQEVIPYAYHFMVSFEGQIRSAIKLGDVKKARSLLDTIAILKEPENIRNNTSLLLEAEYYALCGDHKMAQSYYEKAKDSIYNFKDNDQQKLIYHLNYAKYLETRGESNMATNSIDNAVTFANYIQSESSKWTSEIIDARVSQISLNASSGNYLIALRALDTFISIIDEKLMESVIFNDHLGFIDEFYSIFELGLEIIKSQYPSKTSLAFKILECTKSLSLFKESIFSNHYYDEATDNLMALYKTRTRSLTLSKVEYLQSPSVEKRNRQYELNLLVEQTKKEIIDRTPVYRKHFAHQISLEIHQSIIASDQVHILSFAGKSHFYALTINNDSATLDQFDTQLHESSVNEYLKTVSEVKEFKYMSFGLDPLFNHIAKLSKKKLIIFSGDGIIDLLPLESIILTNRKFLLENTAFSYVPSARIYHFLITTDQNSKDIKAAVYVPGFKNSLRHLPYAKRESSFINSLMSVDIFEDEVASKSHFMNSCTNYDILHLVTHASSGENSPSKSYINFHDSKLYFDEIKSLVLNAELVTLSACETNVGQNFNGEGVQSLSRNFIAAGAKSVISSMWAVNDQTTSEIIISFYTYLKEGYSKAESLQKAKIDYLENNPGEGQHPYYWAGLVLTGNPDPIFPRPSKAPYYVLVSVLCIGIAYYGKRKLRKTAA